MKFKEKFIEKYSKLIDFEEYKESVIRTFARKSIRINTLGYSVSEVKKSLDNLMQHHSLNFDIDNIDLRVQKIEKVKLK